MYQTNSQSLHCDLDASNALVCKVGISEKYQDSAQVFWFVTFLKHKVIMPTCWSFK